MLKGYAANPGTEAIVNKYMIRSDCDSSHANQVSTNSRVEEIAKRRRVSMAAIGLAWVMNRPGVTAPIVGTTSLQNLEDLLSECSHYLPTCLGN